MQKQISRAFIDPQVPKIMFYGAYGSGKTQSFTFGPRAKNNAPPSCKGKPHPVYFDIEVQSKSMAEQWHLKMMEALGMVTVQSWLDVLFSKSKNLSRKWTNSAMTQISRWRSRSCVGAVAQDCEWGEAIHYFLYDWCGSDLALVDGLASYLYGNWKERLYDETVTDCLDQWLKADPVVQKYRRSLTDLDGPSVKYIRLLCSGGKLPCHAPGIEHETDQALRALLFWWVAWANLIPGFYQVS